MTFHEYVTKMLKQTYHYCWLSFIAFFVSVTLVAQNSLDCPLGQLNTLYDDLESAASPDLENFFDANGIKSWEKVFTKPAWRTNTTYLTKVSRYTDNGLEIVEEGGELFVKQADGVKVGKLDPNDPYYPGEMKVKGEVSGRHFDPDDAGGSIVKKSWSNPNINNSGVDDISTHLSRFDPGPEMTANNNFMLDRLNQIKNGQLQPTDFDKRFYTHELEELARYQNKGIPNGTNDPDFYYNAHTASLESYSVNEVVEKLYPPNVPYPGFVGY